MARGSVMPHLQEAPGAHSMAAQLACLSPVLNHSCGMTEPGWPCKERLAHCFAHYRPHLKPPAHPCTHAITAAGGLSSEEAEELQQENAGLREALEGARQELQEAYKQVCVWDVGWGLVVCGWRCLSRSMVDGRGERADGRIAWLASALLSL